MICPNCGTHIPDDALRCPACHADIGLTRKLPRLDATWCPSCGALVPEGADVCPSCGMPLIPAAVASQKTQGTSAVDDSLDEALEHEQTHAMPRIESAVPSGPDPYDETAKHDHMPRARVILLASLASLLVVGGTILAITHPWDPNAFSTRATEPADTSTAGYPGEISTLTGQDSEGSDTQDDTAVSADQQTYEKLTDIYTQLGDIEGELSDSKDKLDEIALTGALSDRVTASNNQRSVAIELSNLISSIDDVDVSTGTYADSVQNMKTLGNYLRNWSDALTEAWTLAAGYDDPSGHRSDIYESLKNEEDDSGKNSYQKLFDDNYASWEPQAPAT